MRRAYRQPSAAVASGNQLSAVGSLQPGTWLGVGLGLGSGLGVGVGVEVWGRGRGRGRG